jgi:hypothetical protein
MEGNARLLGTGVFLVSEKVERRLGSQVASGRKGIWAVKDVFFFSFCIVFRSAGAVRVAGIAVS